MADTTEKKKSSKSSKPSSDKKPSSSSSKPRTDKKSSSKPKSSTDKKPSSSKSPRSPRDDPEARARRDEHNAKLKQLTDEHAIQKQNLNEKAASLQAQLEDLEHKVKEAEANKTKKSSSSSEDHARTEALIADAEARATAHQATLQDLTAKLHATEADSQTAHAALKNSKDAQHAAEAGQAQAERKLAELNQRVAELEAELAQAANTTTQLKERLATLQRQLKDAEPTKKVGFAGASTAPAGNGAVPAWKLRQMEQERELAEKRESEQARKLTKVTSIKVRKHEIGHDAVDHEDGDDHVVRPAFKDPLAAKAAAQQAHEQSAVVHDNLVSPRSMGVDQTPEEREAAEEARLLKFLNKK